MVHRCCVPGCTNSSASNKNVSFNTFPKNMKLRNSWMKCINRQGPSGKFSLWKPAKHDRICGIHFNRSGRKTKGDKIPLFFLHHQNKAHRKSREIVDEVPSFCNEVTVADNINQTIIDINWKKLVSIKQNNKNFTLEELEVNDHKDHNYCCVPNASHKSFLLSVVEQMSNEISSLKSKLTLCQQETISLKHKLKNIDKQHKDETRKIEKEVQGKEKFIVENMDEAKLSFYTGFKNHTLYNNFKNFVYPGYKEAKRLSSGNYEENHPNRVLNFDDEMLLVSMKLRLGLLQKDLSYRFQVSQGTVSKVWNFWLDLLASQLRQVPIWPSKNLIKKYLPPVFEEKFPQTRVILDCTEIFIEKPSDCNVQCSTYSTYKHHNTGKALLGIAPNGFVTFVSEVYPGKTSDKEIVEKCGIVDLLELNDDVMADRGFLIEDILKEKGVTLNMPPFLSGKQQFSCEESNKTKNIASLRVHVERVIRCIKCFRILKYVFPASMHTQLNNIWTICCYLVNFMDLPLLERNAQNGTDELDEDFF